MNITGEQVKAAMIAKDILRVNHHACSFCNYMCHYSREGERLFFHPGCHCVFQEARPCDWRDPANWINMQQDEKIKRTLAMEFGVGAECFTS